MSDAERDASRAEDRDEQIVLAEDGTSLPALDVLTGRGFVTGKSGSGKSNSANVVVEALLEAGHPLLIVDVDGEYWGLKERFSVLHAGGGGRCDVVVDESDAETLVDVALGGQPVVLDLSGFLRAEDSTALLETVLERLFRRETELKRPFLLVVEEVHEFIPQQGSLGEVGEVMLQIAKRGRKHGLGLLGLSQRPAAVEKDFITQCDWMVWHKLTWDNDTDVVGRLLGSDAADAITGFEPGEAFLRTDWDDTVQRIRFREKATYDAGSTPGLDERDPPPLVAVDEDVLARFEDDDPGEDSGSSTDPADSAGGSASGGGSANRNSETATAAADGSTPPGEPDAESNAVAMLVEFAFMLAHLVVRGLDAASRGISGAEARLLDAIDARATAVGEGATLSIAAVRWAIRVAVVLVVIGVLLVMA